MKKTLAVIGLAAATLAGAHAQVTNATLYWNANTTNATTTTFSVNGTYFVSDPVFSQFNSSAPVVFINSTSASTNAYPGASGGDNFGLVVHPSSNSSLTPFSPSGPAFAFSITLLDASYTFSLTDFDFGSRRTGTGPQAVRLVGSSDAAFTTPFTIFDITTGQTNGSWVFNNATINTFTSTGNQAFFRLYGYNGQGNIGNAANWRIDDVTLSGSVIPEPSTYALIGLGIAGMIFMVRRRRRVA